MYNSSQIVNAIPLISIVGRNAAMINRCASPARVDDSSHGLDCKLQRAGMGRIGA